MLLRSPALRDHPEYGAHAEQAAAAMAKSAGRNGQAYRRLHLLSLGVPRVSPLMSALISLLRSAGDDFAKGNSYWIDQTISAADAVTLDEQCAIGGSSTIALRDPTILKILLQALFDPAKPPKPGPRVQLLRVIARVAADAAEECEDTSAVLEEASVSESKAHARRAKVHAVLTEAQKICETNEVSEVDAQVAILRRCSSSEPACACGLLVWTRRNLTTPQFSGARFNGTFLPAMLQLVGSIAEAHPGLQGEVCDLVHAILIHEPGKEAEDVSAETAVTLRRRLLECLLWLLTRGCVFPVLAKLHEWLKTADYSLVRHLFTQLLTLCSPPYSEAFGRKLLAMVKEARTLEAHRGDEQRRGLKAFVQAAEGRRRLRRRRETCWICFEFERVWICFEPLQPCSSQPRRSRQRQLAPDLLEPLHVRLRHNNRVALVFTLCEDITPRTAHHAAPMQRHGIFRPKRHIGRDHEALCIKRGTPAQ